MCSLICSSSRPHLHPCIPEPASCTRGLSPRSAWDEAAAHASHQPQQFLFQRNTATPNSPGLPPCSGQLLVLPAKPRNIQLRTEVIHLKNRTCFLNCFIERFLGMEHMLVFVCEPTSTISPDTRTKPLGGTPRAKPLVQTQPSARPDPSVTPPAPAAPCSMRDSGQNSVQSLWRPPGFVQQRLKALGRTRERPRAGEAPSRATADTAPALLGDLQGRAGPRSSSRPEPARRGTAEPPHTPAPAP